MKIHMTTKAQRLAILGRYKAKGNPEQTKSEKCDPEPKPSPEVRDRARLARHKLYEHWREM